MSSSVKNILVVIAGIIFGGGVNMGLITFGNLIIPPPGGVDATSIESLQSSMHLFGPQNFIFPFLAHALGTLAGGFTATKIAANHKIGLAVSVGIFFLLGGIYNAYVLPAPAWFIILDLVVAYIPMGWLGGKLATSNKVETP